VRTVAESRVDRLARIRAAVEAVEDTFGVGIHNYRVPQDVRLADVLWLLGQVSGDREYRVEMFGPVRGEWFAIDRERITEDKAEALEWLHEERESDAEYHPERWRITSSPVRVWTAEEEQ